MGPSMSMGRPILALLLAAALAGCQTLGHAGLVASTVTTELTAEAAAAIADDLTLSLVAQIGPGTTTLRLNQDGSSFGQAFETALRQRGYGIIVDQKTAALEGEPIAYVVDDFEGSVLVRISLPQVELTRIYERSAAGAEPVSPLSVLDHSATASS